MVQKLAKTFTLISNNAKENPTSLNQTCGVSEAKSERFTAPRHQCLRAFSRSLGARYLYY